MQPAPYHAVPEEKRNINGFRILPSGALVTDTPPFDRLFEEGTGNGLYALAVSNWETVPDPGAFFIKNMARQALTRMAHAAAERPDEVDAVLDHLLASATEKAFLAEQFPPVPGAEYATPDIIAGWFEDLRKAIAKEIRARGITPAEWLNGLGAPWNQIGKVFFHLAENRDDATGSRPFAFMATFAHQSAADNQVRHLPLATALKLHEGNYTALLALLQPLKEAARESPLLKRLLDTGKIYTPMAWSAPVGQASTSASSRSRLTGSLSSLSVHRPQTMQRWRMRTISGSGDWLSGLWHQAQARGHPFMKTVLLTPGPSWREKRWMLKTSPLRMLMAPMAGGRNSR